MKTSGTQCQVPPIRKCEDSSGRAIRRLTLNLCYRNIGQMMNNPFLRALSLGLIDKTPSLGLDQETSSNPFAMAMANIATTNELPRLSEVYPILETPAIPVSENPLLSQVENQNDVVDVKKHLQRLEALRQRLDAHLEQRTREAAVTQSNLFREALSRQFEGGLQYFDSHTVLNFAQEKFLDLYPTEDFGFHAVKEYRAIEKDNIDLLNKYQNLIKGATVKISFQSDEYDEVLKVLIKVLPPDMLLRVSDELEKHAPQLAKRQTIEL